MVKYCPIMCYQNKYATHVPCMEEECAWADKDGICLIIKALTQITDPISTLLQVYSVDQNILHNQPTYTTHLVRDITTKTDEGWGGF